MARRPDTPCAGCGKLLWGGKGALPAGFRRCRDCRQHDRREQVDAPCVICGEPSSGSRITCSATCANAARARASRPNAPRGTRPSTMRRCEVCATQFRYTYSKQRSCGRKCGAVLQAQSRPRAVPKVRASQRPKKCVICGSSYTGTSRMFCSDKCRMVRCPGNVVKTGLVESHICRGCEKPFGWQVKGRGNRPVRCEPCRREHKRQSERETERRRRARKRGASCETFLPLEIFERDRWICQLCRKRVPKKAKVPDPKAPTLDHIVPLAEGGPHTRANVQLSHFECNWMKGDRGKPRQLMLFG